MCDANDDADCYDAFGTSNEPLQCCFGKYNSHTIDGEEIEYGEVWACDEEGCPNSDGNDYPFLKFMVVTFLFCLCSLACFLLKKNRDRRFIQEQSLYQFNENPDVNAPGVKTLKNKGLLDSHSKNAMMEEDEYESNVDPYSSKYQNL